MSYEFEPTPVEDQRTVPELINDRYEAVFAYPDEVPDLVKFQHLGAKMLVDCPENPKISIKEVIERSGVSRPSLNRRYPNGLHSAAVNEIFTSHGLDLLASVIYPPRFKMLDDGVINIICDYDADIPTKLGRFEEFFMKACSPDFMYRIHAPEHPVLAQIKEQQEREIGRLLRIVVVAGGAMLAQSDINPKEIYGRPQDFIRSVVEKRVGNATYERTPTK